MELHTGPHARVRAVCAGLGPSFFQLRVRVRQGLCDEGAKAMLRYVRIWKAMFDYIAQQFEGQVW